MWTTIGRNASHKSVSNLRFRFTSTNSSKFPSVIPSEQSPYSWHISIPLSVLYTGGGDHLWLVGVSKHSLKLAGWNDNKKKNPYYNFKINHPKATKQDQGYIPFTGKKFNGKVNANGSGKITITNTVFQISEHKLIIIAKSVQRIDNASQPHSVYIY